MGGRLDGKELKSAELSHYLTTVFSHNPETHDRIANLSGAHARTVTGMQAAANEGLKIACNMVVDASNHTHIVDTYRFLRDDVGIASLSVTKASPPVHCEMVFEPLREDTMEVVLDQVRQLNQEGVDVGFLECYPICMFDPEKHADFLIGRSCAAGVTTCTISPCGEVRPCSPLAEIGGHMSDSTFQEIWDKGLQPWRDGTYKPEACIRCKLFQACTGGCRAEAQCATGSLSGMDPWARCTEERIEASHAALMRFVDKKRNAIDLQDNDRIVVRPLKARKEEYGWMVFTGGIRSGLVTEDAYTMLQRIQASGEMTVQEIIKEARTEPARVHAFIRDALIRKMAYKTSELT